MSMSKIFYGKRGSGVKSAAHALAKDTLCIYGKASADCTCRSCQTKLSSHPDLAVYSKPAYVVDDIEQMLVFGNSLPIISSQKVLVIENMGAITEDSQNKLLKSIESNPALCVIGTVYEGTDVLPTIKSRTNSIFIHPLSEEDFLKKVSDENGILLYYMTSGCLGQVEEMREQIPIYEKVLHALESANGKDLLTALSLVKEKDENAYFYTYRSYIPVLFSYIGKIIIDWYMGLWLEKNNNFFHPQNKDPERYLEIAKIADNGRRISLKDGAIFTKNDFFYLIACICNQLSLIKKEKENNYEQ